MNKSEGKNLLRKLREMEEKKIALSQSRPIFKDIHWRGVGLKVLQIIFKPSFEINKVWDIRIQDDKYVLFESILSGDIIEPGYFQLICDPSQLERIFESFKHIRVNLELPNRKMFGLDGTGYELCLYDLQTSIRVSWWEEPHQDWQEIAHLVSDAIEFFKTLERSNN